MYFVTIGEIYYLSALLLLARHGKILANISSPHIYMIYITMCIGCVRTQANLCCWILSGDSERKDA